MTSSTDQLIKEGHKAIKRGEKTEARQLLQEAAEQNPADYRAWLGLAAVARTPRESLVFIEKAAELKPDNPAVRQARQWAEGLAQQKKAQSETKPQAATPAAHSAPPLRQTPIQERLKAEKTHVVEKTTAAVEPASTPTPLPITVQAVNRGLALRRIIGVAAVISLVIAMGIVAWVAYTSFLNSTGVAGNDAPTAVSTPNTAELALAVVPDAQVSNILPETEPEVEAAAENTATPNPLQPKNIIQGDGSNPRARWTATPPPTQTPTPSPTWVPTFVSPLSEANILKPVGLLPNERWIDVSLSTQSLVAYEGDTPVFETLISSGLANYPTVTGQFRIWLRYTSQTMDGSRLGYDYYLEGVPYVQYFYQDYALHGTYWHNNFGRPMSHGCVNLSTPDSEWLYNFADYGTVVNVHE